MLDPGGLRLVLPKLIGEEPRHEYDVIKSFEKLTSGGYAPSPGVIYPALTMPTEIALFPVRRMAKDASASPSPIHGVRILMRTATPSASSWGNCRRSASAISEMAA